MSVEVLKVWCNGGVPASTFYNAKILGPTHWVYTVWVEAKDELDAWRILHNAIFLEKNGRFYAHGNNTIHTIDKRHVDDPDSD